MMKIGLTGGTGFIGQYVIRGFGDKFDFIVPTARLDMAGLSNKATYIQVPYTKDGFVRAFHDCDAVIHLGGKAIHGQEASICIEPYVSNITLANDLFSACLELGIKNVVCASSVSVYRKEIGYSAKEEDMPAPTSAYGISKVAVELLADLFNKKHGMKIRVLRIGQVLGFRQLSRKLFFGMLLWNSIEGKPVSVYGEGREARDLIYVKDVATAIVLAAQKEETTGIYNISSNCAYSNLDMAEAYCKGFDNAAGIVYVPVERENMLSWKVDNTKAQKELGFVPAFGLLDMVKDMKEEYLLTTHSQQ